MANNNVYAASIFAKNPTAVWALDEDFYKTHDDAILSYTGTLGTVSGSGPYTATLTVPDTVLFQANMSLAATPGTGNFGSGTVTVVQVTSGTTLSISSTATMTSGTVTNIYYELALETLSGINLESAKGFRAKAYGTDNVNDGFYLATNEDADFDDLKANNYGVPLVFGANTATNIYPNKHYVNNEFSHYDPSIIVPGFGFLNSNGSQRSMTLEMWLKINSEAHYPVRIVGPISSDDGLYVNGPFLSLKIGSTIGSHYIDEWARPMLVSIFYTPTTCGVVINGETVISILPSSSDRQFPDLYTNGLSNDWIGFYAHDKVTPIQIDCISIYPYKVSEILSKVNFVKGQAVEYPQKKNKSYSDAPIEIDFQYAKNANSYTYPGVGGWGNGISKNMKASYTSLRYPDYALPDFHTQDTKKDITNWYSFNEYINTPISSISNGIITPTSTFFRLSDNDLTLEDEKSLDSESYLSFESIAQTGNSSRSFHAVLQMPENPRSETIAKLYDGSGRTFEILISSDTASSTPTYTLDYVFKINGSIEETVSSTSISPSDVFGVGIDFSGIKSNNQQSSNIQSFFINPSNIKMLFGGTELFTNSFSGKVFCVSFSDTDNHENVFSSLFSNGIFATSTLSSNNQTLSKKTSSYTLFASYTFNTLALDIATRGSFVDYVPLSTLAKSSINASGDSVQDIDAISFMLGAPNYTPSNSITKSFVRFRNIISDTTPTSVVSATNSLITPDPETFSLESYSVVDGDVVLIPDSVSSNLSNYGIEMTLEFEIPGIFRNPLSLSRMGVSSFVIDKNVNAKTPIGTRHGRDIFQVSLSNNLATQSYNTFVPYAIYKDSSPYMYMTSQSGIRNIGTLTGSNGIEIPINKFGVDNYIVSVMQMSVLQKDVFSDEEEIFRVNGHDEDRNPQTIVFYASKVDVNGYVATISAKYYDSATATYTACPDVSIHVNGIEYNDVAYGAIRTKEWAVLSVSFTNFMYFSNITTGNVQILGSLLVNGFSTYQLMPYQVGKSRLYRTWDQVSLSQWGDWDNLPDGLWKNVWIAGTVPVDGLPLENIYNSYFGSSIISPTTVGEQKIKFNATEKSFIIGSVSSQIVRKPL